LFVKIFLDTRLLGYDGGKNYPYLTKYVLACRLVAGMTEESDILCLLRENVIEIRFQFALQISF
jgi:hypothetical protein